jgi:hypothetical protein
LHYSAADAAGNVATCMVTVHVADVDECADETHTCHANAICQNLEAGGGAQATGTYDCACKDGFEGDGWTCESNFVIAQTWAVVFQDKHHSGNARAAEIGLHDTHQYAYPSNAESMAAGVLPHTSFGPGTQVGSSGTNHHHWYDSYCRQTNVVGAGPWVLRYEFTEPRAIKQLLIGSTDGGGQNSEDGFPSEYIKLMYRVTRTECTMKPPYYGAGNGYEPWTTDRCNECQNQNWPPCGTAAPWNVQHGTTEHETWVLHSEIDLLSLAPNGECVPPPPEVAHTCVLPRCGMPA